MQVKKTDFDNWNIDRPITVQIAGNVIDLKQTERPPRKIEVQWIDADSYVDLRTGEIKQANRSKSRGDAMSAVNLRRTFAKMRGLINANWYGDNNELLVTLTYKENMQDPKRLAHDLDIFNKRMKRALGEVKYLTAVEPQARGAWHAHILVKQLTSHYTYWPHEEVSRLWEHGTIIDVQRLRNCDNVGAYLSAYLTDTPANAPDYPDPLNGLRDTGTCPPKRVIKGGRLHMYPRGMRIFRASQNLERPTVKKIRPYSAEYWALVSGSQITYQSTLELSESNDNEQDYLFNKIHQMQLNCKGASRPLTDKTIAEVQSTF